MLFEECSHEFGFVQRAAICDWPSPRSGYSRGFSLSIGPQYYLRGITLLHKRSRITVKGVLRGSDLGYNVLICDCRKKVKLRCKKSKPSMSQMVKMRNTHAEHNRSAFTLIADVPSDMDFRRNGAKLRRTQPEQL
jgi:hypothetical protein